MSHRDPRRAKPSAGAVKQASNNDLRGLQLRGAVTADEARELRRRLINGSPAEQQRAYDEVQRMIEQSPSHRRGFRSRSSWPY